MCGFNGWWSSYYLWYLITVFVSVIMMIVFDCELWIMNDRRSCTQCSKSSDGNWKKTNSAVYWWGKINTIYGTYYLQVWVFVGNLMAAFDDINYACRVTYNRKVKTVRVWLDLNNAYFVPADKKSHFENGSHKWTIRRAPPAELNQHTHSRI